MKAAISKAKAVYSPICAASWSLLDSCSPELPQYPVPTGLMAPHMGKEMALTLHLAIFSVCYTLLEDSHLHSESSLHQAGKQTFLPTNSLVWEGHPFHEKHAHVEHNLDNLLHPGDAGSRGDPSFSYGILSHL